MKVSLPALALAFSMAGAASAQTQDARPFYLGADLSYVNELEDCGAVYRNDGLAVDPYVLFHDKGANLVRLRLWVNPTWTRYSTLADVKRSLKRAQGSGMQTLLDLHYSDDWADPGDQIIPKEWAATKTDEDLAAKVYDYTVGVLAELEAAGLMPDMVQVGNETNTEILLPANVPEDREIDWTRNAMLLNAGILGVSEASKAAAKQPRIMVHIAQPENVEPWFDAAFAAGILDFDVIGVSYYPKWSSRDMKALGQTIRRLRHKYAKDVVVVETAYPWTLRGDDDAANLLGEDSLIPAYPATLAGQRSFLIDLTQTVRSNDGSGVVYWEPAWISSKCATRWGKGSHWENNAFFDYENKSAHSGFDFFAHDYAAPVPVTFEIKSGAASEAAPIYLWASFLEGRDFTIRLDAEEGVYRYRALLPVGEAFQYQLYEQPDLKNPLIGEGLVEAAATSAGLALNLKVSRR